MANKNKKGYSLTPELQQAMSIMKNQSSLNRQAMRNLAYPVASGTTGRLSDYTYRSTAGEDTYLDDWNKSEVEDENVSSSKSWYQNIGEGIADQMSDVANSGRMFMQKLADQWIEDDFGKIGDLTRDKEDLKLILEYKDLNKQLNEIISNPDANQKDLQQALEINNRIKELDDYFTGEGRTHDIIAELMYDRNNLSNGDIFDINVLYGVRDANIKQKDGFSFNPLGLLTGTADWMIETLISPFKESGYKTKEVVKQLDKFSEKKETVNRLINTLYKGSDQNKNRLQSTLNDNLINRLMLDNDDSIKEKSIDLNNDIEFAKTGRLKYYMPSLNTTIGGDKGIDIFDPEDVPEQFKKNQEKYSGGFLSIFAHPLYTFPEVASTVGLFKHQLGAMAGDATLAGILKFIAKKYGVFAALDATQVIGSTAMGLKAAYASRKDETNLEAVTGRMERTLTELQNTGVNINGVLDEIRQYANNKLHVDANRLDDQLLLELAMAYDVPVSDSKFADASEKSKQGIQKLINENNALAIHDYLETIPFLSYGGSALLRLAKSNKLVQKTGGILSKTAEYTKLNKLKPALTNMTGKVLGKVISKDLPKLNIIANHPKLGLMGKHIGQHVYDKSKLFAYEGIMEGAEEGVQEVLQNRYKRGEYDDYKNVTRMFDPNEILELPGLYKDAAFDYFGINSGDPDNASENIRKAVNIGLSSSVMFTSILGGFKNIRNNIHDVNTRQLIALLKADNTVGNLAAQYAKEAQDQAHIGIFFDSFAKNSKSGAHLIKSLTDLRDAVNENETLVKKSDVEGDMKLATAAWLMYNNPFIKEILKESDIKTNSDAHKQIVINGTKAIVDSQMTLEQIQDQRKTTKEQRQNHINMIDAIFDGFDSEEERKTAAEKNPHLFQMIETFRDNFKKQNDQIKLNIVDDMVKNIKTTEDVSKNKEYAEWLNDNKINLSDAINEDTFAKYAEYKRENDIISRFTKSINSEKTFSNNNHIRNYVQSKLGTNDNLSDKLKEYWNNEDLRKEAINAAIQDIKKDNFGERMFVKNHIRSFEYYVKMQQTKKMLDLSKNQLERTKELRRITGLDVNTDRLEGIVSSLLKEYDTQLKREDEIVNGKGSVRVAKDKESTFEDFFKEYNVLFDDQGEFENNIAALQLNSAAVVPLLQIASMYRYGNAVSLADLQEAIYGTNTDNSIIKDTVREFEALKNRLDQFDAEDDVSEFDPEKINDNLNKLSRNAVKQLILDQLKYSEERRLIARRNFANDLGMPEETLAREETLTTEESNNQESNNQELGKKNKGKKSAAEKAVEENILHGKKGKKSGEELLEEIREKRKSKSKNDEESNDDSEDDLEDDEEAIVQDTSEDETATDTKESSDDESSDEEDNTVVTESQEHVDSDGVIDPVTENEVDFPEEDVHFDEEDENQVDTADSNVVVNDPFDDIDDEFNGTIDENEIQEIERDLDLEEIDKELEEEAKWVPIFDTDDLEFDDDAGLWAYEGELLSEEQSAQIDEDLFIQGELRTSSVRTITLPDGTKQTISEKETLFQKDDVKDLVSQTFFYNPNPKKKEDGLDETVVLSIKGKLNKPIASGRQLAKKLLEKGWFKSAKKYYVVAKPQDTETSYGDKRDALTVVMIVEDDSNCYVVSLRSLGITISELKKKRNDLTPEEQSYYDTWYNANQHGVLVNKEADLVAWLETKNVDWNKVFADGKNHNDEKGVVRRVRLRKFRQAVIVKAKELAFSNYVATHPRMPEDKLKSSFEYEWKNGPKKERGWSDEKYKAKLADDQRSKNIWIEKAKLYFAKEGTQLLTRGQISNQIDKLRKFRNDIIESYCIKKTVKGQVEYELPDQVKTNVVPTQTNLGIGKYDNVKVDGEPVYRSLFPEEASLEEIQESIEKGETQFGFGRGFFGNDPFTISNIFDLTQLLWSSKGASGKIFWFTEGINEDGVKVPVCLAEELFDYQEKIVTRDGKQVREQVFANEEDDFRLCLGYDEGGKLVNINNEGYIPSTAEILLYMLCEKFDIGILDRDKYRSVVEFFIHNDIRTLLSQQPKYGQNPIGQFAQKQLYFEKSPTGTSDVLHIAMPTGQIINNKPVYEERTFDMDALFGEDSEATRLEVVKAIAKQMHWNTDIAHMNNKLNVDGSDEVSQFVSYILNNNYKSETPEDLYEEEVSLFGNSLMTFKVSDFFNLKNGELVPKKNVSVMAWMIKNKKLKTDLSEQKFSDPWVFGKGVTVEGSQANQIEQETAELTPLNKKDEPKESKRFSLYDQTKLDWFINDFDVDNDSNVATTKEAAKEIIEALNNTRGAKEHNGVKNNILFLPPKENLDPDEGYGHFMNQLQEFIKQYNTTVEDEYKLPEDLKNIEKIIKDGGTVINRMKNMLTESYANQEACVTVTIYNDGTLRVSPQAITSLNWKNGFTGIYSTTKSKEQFDELKVRKWLNSVLGIDDANVVLTDAAMKSMYDEEIFGLTNVYTDVISQELTGYIQLSTQYGAGVAYHEAWHYINLLVHTKKDRMMIYNDYLKSHKKLRKKGMTFHDIEEIMAEEFRAYVEGLNDNSIFGRVKRAFNNLLDFISITRRKSLYRNVFKAIQQGGYRNSKISQKEALEFKKEYIKGIPALNFALPSMTFKQTQQLDIDHYSEYFEAFRSISNKLILDYNITTSDELMNKLNGSRFDDIIGIIDELENNVEDDKLALLETMKKNKSMLKKMLADTFLELGFKAKVKGVLKVEESENNDPEDATKSENLTEQGEKSYDRIVLTRALKENAAVETKLFFRSIPYQESRLMKDGTTSYIPIHDDYGVLKMYTFDEAWQLVLGELFSCKSFAEMDKETYASNSIMGNLERLKNVSAFWNSAYKKFKRLADSKTKESILMRSQIFSTLCSSKTRISLIELNAPYIRDAYDIDEIEGVDYEDDNEEQSQYISDELIYDRDKTWSLKDDSAFLVFRNITTRWSKNLVSNGLVKYDLEKGTTVVNREFVTILKERFDDLSRRVSKSLSTKDVDYQADLYGKGKQTGIILDLISLFNTMGMPIDFETFNVFLSMASDKKDGKELTNVEKIKLLNKMFSSDSAGSIKRTINTLYNSAGKNIIQDSGYRSNDKQLDEALNNPPKKSQLSLLALSYNNLHPNLSDYTVKGTNGESYYPINLNNEVTDKIHDINDKNTGVAELLGKSPYCKHSIVLGAADQVNENDSNTELVLNTFVGLKDARKAKGADFFGITAMEDYLAKMLMTEQDQIIFPTMADKKTWYSIASSNIKLSHDAILHGVPKKFKDKAILEIYKEENPDALKKENGTPLSDDEVIANANIWFKKLKNTIKSKESSLEDFEYAENIINEINKTSKKLLEEQDLSGVCVESFDQITINRFCNYFYDELQSLIQYYNRDNIKRLVNNPNARVENFHGKVNKEGRMDFSGNGGKFRYMYDVIKIGNINLNQRLESLFELQKLIETGKVKDKNKKDDIYSNATEYAIQEKDKEGNELPLDGFEMIRQELNNLKKKYFNPMGAALPELQKAMNAKLMSMVDTEMRKVTEDGSVYQLGTVDEDGNYIPKHIPTLLLQSYAKKFQEKNLTNVLGSVYDSEDIQSQAFYALIANYVINTITSAIEVEKVFTGDSAFFKWKKTDGDEYVKVKVKHTVKMQDGSEVLIEETVSVENLDDTYSDKIKRLGGVLSPGSEMRLDFSQIELDEPGNETLANHLYTVLNVEDIETPSSFLDEIQENFKKQLIVDKIRCSNPNWYKKAIDKISKEDYYLNHSDIQKKLLENMEYQIDLIYRDNKFYDKILKNIPAAEMLNIDSLLKKQMAPYTSITVADALVYIRPELYRKIKIGLGEWSFKPDKNGYSDEIAYNIIEHNRIRKGNEWITLKEGEWMTNPEYVKYTKKFQANALKMSYYQNAARLIFNDQYFNLPIYNKMALFPMFKFHRSTQVGRVIYDRMNDEEKGCIDMIAFKSAVKVGAVQNGPSLVEKTEVKKENGQIQNKEEIKNSVARISDVINNASDKKIDYRQKDEGGKNITVNNSENTLPISVQSLDNLRLQLNTHAHEKSERNIGSQMFKLAFSNIIDDAEYGTGKAGRRARKGSEIKKDIMRQINALTDRGVENIKSEFYKTHKKKIKKQDGTEEEITYTTVDTTAVRNFILRIIESNSLGVSAHDIIRNGGIVSSLVQRDIFEQSASSFVTSEIVDIKTKGGTAIQQSMFGFAAVAHDKQTVSTDSEYLSEEDEKLDQLIHDENIILSLSVRAQKELERNNIHNIKDIIENRGTINSIKSNKVKAEIEDLLESLNLSWDTKTSFQRRDLYSEYNGGEELKWNTKEGSMEVLLTMNFFEPVLPAELKNESCENQRQWLVNNDIIKGKKKSFSITVNGETKTYNVKKEGEKSDPKPFGIGYRIPTQGMSSMFGFIVADVLPKQVGDLIIVPREFTAQTGSDFDVDKLYLATYSYSQGQRETINKDDKEKPTVGAISNRLLDDYIDIITDIRNYSNARASIDVITDIIKKEILPTLRDKEKGYRVGMSQLTPQFQCMRKREFGVGKDGIGPFALNITNMALTQFCHLTFDYGDNEYEFGHMDAIYGEDEMRIADWLSAMVNAHVDVAKDAYIFTLNVNKATYNHCNFMLRAGKGKQTFMVLAQPAIKSYSEKVLNANGIYGKYIDLDNGSEKNDSRKLAILTNTIKNTLSKLKQLASDNEEAFNDDQKALINNVISYYEDMTMSAEDRKAKGDDYVPAERLEDKNIIFKQEHIVDGPKNAFKIKNRAENALKHFDDKKSADKQADAIIWNLYCLEAFKDMNKYAEALSELVQCSKIDTKKFGNNIVSMYNYKNNIMKLMYGSSVFTINDEDFVPSLPKEKDKKGNEKDPDTSTISKYALERYFKDTFLWKKFDLTLKYVKTVLTGQTFKSSDIYYDIFMNVMRNIKGNMTVTDTKGNEYNGYSKVYKDDVIQAIGSAIDNILRFNTFMNTGYTIYQNYHMDGKNDVIDFTYGGDMNAVIQDVDRLIYGKQKQNEKGEYVVVEKSIFERVKDLMDKITSGDKNPAYRTLRKMVNGTYEIRNDLLNYLNPLLPTDKYPIGRMLLQEAQMKVKGDRKARLIAAFSELLSSTDEEVRKIAEDLARYAYFSTYDQNTRDSFFDLVPPSYRRQYDVALKTMMTRLKNSKTRTDIEILSNITGIPYNDLDYDSMMQRVVNKVIDVMSRNYWYSDEYVPSFKIPKNSYVNFQEETYGKTIYPIPTVLSVNPMIKFPAFIASSNVTGRPLYIKSSFGGETMLYKRTGVIRSTKMGDNGPKTVKKYDIYTPVPKAGLHAGKMNQFELYCDYDHSSMFDNNILPTEFAEDIIRKLIQEMVDNENNNENYKLDLELEWDTEQVSYVHSSENVGQYKTSDNNGTIFIPGMNITVAERANGTSNKQANLVINITDHDVSETPKNISKDVEGKTVHYNINKSADSIIEDLKRIAEQGYEEGLKISFTTDLFDNNFKTPQSIIDKLIEDTLTIYRASFAYDVTDIDAKVQAHKESLSESWKIKDEARGIYVSQIMNDLLSVITDNITVYTTITSMNNGKTALAFALADNNGEYRKLFTSNTMKFYIDEDMLGNKKSAATRNKLRKRYNAIIKDFINKFSQQNESAEDAIYDPGAIEDLKDQESENSDASAVTDLGNAKQDDVNKKISQMLDDLDDDDYAESYTKSPSNDNSEDDESDEDYESAEAYSPKPKMVEESKDSKENERC